MPNITINYTMGTIIILYGRLETKPVLEVGILHIMLLYNTYAITMMVAGACLAFNST